MDWQSAILLGAALGALAILVVRTEPRRRRRIALFVPLPACFLIYRWAAYRGAWLELGLASVLAVVAYVGWWAAIGRSLPPAEDSTIRVWTPEDPF